MGDQANELWRYYRALAEQLGRGEDGNQAGYSLLWFFQSPLREKGPLLRAFLGVPEAVETLREDFDRMELPDLEETVWPNRDYPPNHSQKLAIRRALACPVSFIQGPPGTGKTATIRNLLSCLGPEETAAVVSSNREALNNVTDDLEAVISGTPSSPESGKAAPAEKWITRLGDKRIARLGNSKLREAFFKAATAVFGPPSPEEGTAPAKCLEGLSFEQFRRWTGCRVITSTLHSLQKCFRDSRSLPFDYVIIDEASQVSVLCGLIALSSAKHLVVVGDEKQLSAFIKEKLETPPPQEAALKRYAVKGGSETNFLSTAAEVFFAPREEGGLLGPHWQERTNTLLNEHYRCDPGIIEFCNRTFYENRLDIKTKSTGDGVPIRVIWYDGDYCEGAEGAFPDDHPDEETSEAAVSPEAPAPDPEKKRSAKRHNHRQVSIFVEEEWPRLQARLKEESLSVCILAPFKDQLRDLEEALKARSAQDRQQVPLELSDGQMYAEGDAEEEKQVSIPMLTIHKAQGKEFDLVYLLPTEDAANWEWPWSQGARLVNVAVSRAKRELCLIVSSLLMDQETRESLTPRPLPLPFQAPAHPDERPEAKRQQCVRKLVAYARKEGGSFHKTAQISIFDELYQIKWLIGHLAGNSPWRREQFRRRYGLWSPERIVEKALRRICDSARLLRSEVPIRSLTDAQGQTLFTPEDVEKLILEYEEQAAASLTAFKAWQKEQKSRRQDPGSKAEQPQILPPILDPARPDVSAKDKAKSFYDHSKFDFVLCDKDGYFLLAVEADGEYHRTDPQTIGNDILKDRIFERLLGGKVLKGNRGPAPQEAGTYLLRLPSDGSTWLETDALREDAEPADQEGSFSIDDLVYLSERRLLLPPAPQPSPEAADPLKKRYAILGLLDLQRVLKEQIKDQGEEDYLLGQMRVCAILQGTLPPSNQQRILRSYMPYYGILSLWCKEEGEVKEVIDQLLEKKVLTKVRRSGTSKAGKPYHVQVLAFQKARGRASSG